MKVFPSLVHSVLTSLSALTKLLANSVPFFIITSMSYSVVYIEHIDCMHSKCRALVYVHTTLLHQHINAPCTGDKKILKGCVRSSEG